MNVRTIGIAVIVVALVAAFTGIVSAVPDGAEGTAEAPVTKGATTATTDDAQGGYIAELDLDGLQQTDKWQGYYGEITGEITLDNVAGDTMYDWALSTPTGEVYATTLGTLPVWSDFTTTAATLTDINTAYSFESAASDNADDTFTADSSTAFYLASTSLAAGFAPAVETYAEVEGTGAWETAVLYNGTGTSSDAFLFVGIIETDQPSFMQQTGADTCDYQMIVPENPAGTTTEYTFYLELI